MGDNGQLEQSEKVNILLVDDRWENLVSLRAVLESPDYNLVKACSGREALRELMAQDFALILLDVQMPIMNGFETANMIKSREKSKAIPIIFVTGVSTDEPFKYKGYHVGAVDYICKPFDPEILRSKVAVFADLYRKNQRLIRQERLLREAELRRVENESLRREQTAHQKYRDLVDGISNGIVWIADAGTLSPTFLSPQIAGVLGYNESEWIGNSSFWRHILHPDDHDMTLATLRQSAVERTEHSLEHRFLRADGKTLWFQTRVRLQSSLNELQGLSVDITHLKEIESALLEEETRFRFLAAISSALSESLDFESRSKLVASLPIPKVADSCFFDVLDENGALTRRAWSHFKDKALSGDFYSNHPAASALETGKPVLLNLDSREPSNEPAASEVGFLLLMRQLDAVSLISLPLFAHGRSLGCITLCCHRSSGRRYDAHNIPFVEELIGRFAMAIDNAKLFKEAKEAIAARDEFLSIASHELKTPITSLKMQLQITQHGFEPKKGKVPPPEKISKFLDTCSRQVDRLTGLIEDLLDVTRAQAGKLTFEAEDFQLDQLIREVVDRFSDHLSLAHCPIELELDPEIRACWDRVRIEQIIVNLLSNAIKYAPTKRIRIISKRIDNHAVLTFADEGPGIPKNRQAKIFERFERAISSRNVNGLGLGLFIVKKIVEAHEGSISLESEPGKGSRFIVDLPLKPHLVAQSYESALA